MTFGWILDALAVIGVCFMAWGCWQAWPPLCWIVLGLAITAGAIMAQRRSDKIDNLGGDANG